jgi:hypothetical protein
VNNENPSANGRDDQPEDPIFNDEAQPDDQSSSKGHPPLKGTDTPAHTDLAYAEREKGKRVTM